MARSKALAQEQTDSLINQLTSLGWLINHKKSQLEPTQSLEHLGFHLESHNMTIRLPGTKVRDLRRSIQTVLSSPLQTPRKIHSLTMRIKAATLALFPANLYTQSLLQFKNASVKRPADWDKATTLPQQCLEELRWWLTNLSKWNGQSLLPQLPSHTVYVDASNLGWGGSYQGTTVQGLWTQEEAGQSINWRELKAIDLTLRSFTDLQHTTVLIRTDNTTAKAYVNRQGGTKSQKLNQLATNIWERCLRNGLRIQAQHIPGIQNKIADYASRHFFTKNLWQLVPPAFQQIQTRYGPHDVDLFADRTSNLLPQYVSWKPDPEAIATDALSIPWNHLQNPYLNLPWNLIHSCLKKIQMEKVRQATIVVPYWQSAIWFPVLLQMATKAPILMNPQQATRVTVPSATSPWTNNHWKLSVWRISGIAFNC
jgi:hypothetical protein